MNRITSQISRIRTSLPPHPSRSSHLSNIRSNIISPPSATAGEKAIHEKLLKAFQPTKLAVNDVSGGCGSMYAVLVASPKFKGVSLVKQHRMVTEALQADIKEMHGIQIKTEASS
ncbi:hypothetical protein SmJEL517_g02765 [Synchytrium microbalum]|uniref:BolA protein n=1 Tax=Synchytrium microbalum TaxID=1806994 RepID=A0A507C0Q9_9FUNG|nr:uncharacterized protein SmJEL517_g02765 [Synchytrium microbalum]TPX34677.1 hypothetical protein SmJEL517_g02765 [Synchytrium microbalum]